ncbi:MAG: hypothetical protein JW884_14975 [Deltaproteobacteria bacterium]|nr:hypothetical protein [Deltaproteobacteria bacterium]
MSYGFVGEDLAAIPGLQPGSLAGGFEAAGQSVKILAIQIGVGDHKRMECTR